ncbi:MAG: hypothetical protein KC910_26470 [Candidatus Eremiobacteraeota bacterium]|nr:hypothetical protein [Candidatus Eremiobacteraeota bacterium]
MVIRPLHRAARTRRQARQLHRQPDLIERPLSGLSQAGRNAGRFFLQKGLPLVGVALGGGAGLAAGTVATGVLSYLDAPEQSPRQRLTGALVTAAGAGLVAGAAGLVHPALALGLLGVGTGLAAVLEFGSPPPQNWRVDLGGFAQAYAQRAERLLAERGLQLPDSRPGFSLSETGANFRAQRRIAEITAFSCQHLGPAAVVSLVEQLGRERFDSQSIDSAEPVGVTSRQQRDGIELVRVKDLAGTTALAETNRVLVDSSLEPGTPLHDFVLGHELSHVNHQDWAARLAVMTVRDSLAACASGVSRTWEKATVEATHQTELRSDAEGMDYALKQGHSRSAVLQAARDLFGEDQASAQHPAGVERLEALVAVG